MFYAEKSENSPYLLTRIHHRRCSCCRCCTGCTVVPAAALRAQIEAVHLQSDRYSSFLPYPDGTTVDNGVSSSISMPSQSFENIRDSFPLGDAIRRCEYIDIRFELVTQVGGPGPTTDYTLAISLGFPSSFQLLVHSPLSSFTELPLATEDGGESI